MIQEALGDFQFRRRRLKHSPFLDQSQIACLNRRAHVLAMGALQYEIAPNPNTNRPNEL